MLLGCVALVQGAVLLGVALVQGSVLLRGGGLVQELGGTLV